MAYGSGKPFQRQPCGFCRNYTGHGTSNCPSPEAREKRRARAKFLRAVRALRVQEGKAMSETHTKECDRIYEESHGVKVSAECPACRARHGLPPLTQSTQEGK